YAVTQRTHEIGIRMALGARAPHVLRLALGQGIRLAMTGLALGLLAAFALTRLMKNLLFGVEANDPLTFTAIAMLLTIVALLACWFPGGWAKRVARMFFLGCE